MLDRPVRLRFAPAPTGMMHLGNIRTALMNALYATQHRGTFIMRIEDTDADRNYDPNAEHIRADLAWLGLHYAEGPGIGGPHAPYFQSQRTELYAQKLTELRDTNKIYRCFCTEEELERKRERQRALKLPPRYDRTCFHRTEADIAALLATNTPFVWRLAIDHARVVTITDLARKSVTFEMKHFSDFPLTRQDGSFTFLFANCVDDIDMAITHVFRGEEHLSNTACQTALYEAFGMPLPIFWHMPLLCNNDGKKLSKRDFGFSLRDLRDAGFLPQAILNYLAIIGSSYEHEIMDFTALTQTINFDHLHTAGRITYDVDKFHWVNRKWIERLSPTELLDACMPFLVHHYPDATYADTTRLTAALQIVRPEMNTLIDAAGLLDYFFKKPENTKTAALQHLTIEELQALAASIAPHVAQIANPNTVGDTLKTIAREKALSSKHLFWFIRLALTGRHMGPSMHELLTIIGSQEAAVRIEIFLDQFTQH